MKQVEQCISPLVVEQFPDFYKEEGPLFISFIKAFYEWQETTNNTIYHARSLPSYRDIDTTLDDFIVHFKEKYLKNIQFETASNKRLFVKNSLPFYRAKGTERSVDLFFKLIYGIPAKVYYPGDDVFKLSDGEWIIPTYLEVTPSTRNLQFINKQIVGVSSGATAFVEDMVVKKAKGKYIHVFYLSNVVGNFELNELLRLSNETVDDITVNPRTIGSLTSVNILDGGSGFEIGQTVNFISDNGAYGKALVTGIEEQTGIVEFTLIDGGYGYNSLSEVLVSEKILTVNSMANVSFSLFETVSQHIANIQFSSANGTFTQWENVYRYYANNDVSATGKILSTTQTDGNGHIIVSVTSGDFLTGVSNVFTTGNAIFANIVSNTNINATANVIGSQANVSFVANGYVGEFEVGEEIYQPAANARVVSVSINEGDTIVVRTSNNRGTFLSGLPLTGRDSGAVANLQSFISKVGVFNVVQTFYSNASSKLIGQGSAANGYISAISAGSGADFSIGANTDLLYSEVISISNDYLADYAAVNLNSTAYGFPANPTANATANTTDVEVFIADILTYANVTIGKISRLVGINEGADYNEAPMVKIHEPLIYQLHLDDYSISYTDATGTFSIGELVRQSHANGVAIANGALGSIISANSSRLFVERLSVGNSFSTGYLVGVSSGVVANVTSVSDTQNTVPVGLDAVVNTEALIADGSVTNLQIISSGFGYINNEEVTFYLSSNSDQIGTAQLNLDHQGVSEGFYKQTGGFLSSNKYLHDNYYYQEYSYDIITGLPFAKYADMYKKVLHVAGTAVFGTYEVIEQSNSEISYANSAIEINI